MSQVKAYTSSVIAEAKDILYDTIDMLAAATANAARSDPETPRDTSFMANSIEHDTQGLKAEVFTECGYGGFVHEGTARMSGYPFFKYGYETAKDDFKATA